MAGIITNEAVADDACLVDEERARDGDWSPRRVGQVIGTVRLEDISFGISQEGELGLIFCLEVRTS